MNAAVLVNDTLLRIRVHAGRSHMMLVPMHVAGPVAVIFGYDRLEPTESGAGQFLSQQAMRDGESPLFFRRPPPVDRNFSQAKSVEIISEPDPALPVRQLLGRAEQWNCG